MIISIKEEKPMNILALISHSPLSTSARHTRPLAQIFDTTFSTAVQLRWLDSSIVFHTPHTIPSNHSNWVIFLFFDDDDDYDRSAVATTPNFCTPNFAAVIAHTSLQ